MKNQAMTITFSWSHFKDQNKPTAQELAHIFNMREGKNRWRGWSWTDRNATLKAFTTTQETLGVEVRTLRGSKIGRLTELVEKYLSNNSTNVDVRINGMHPMGYAMWLEYQLSKYQAQNKK